MSTTEPISQERLVTPPRCIGFNPCDRPPGPINPRFCDRCQELRVTRLTARIDTLTTVGQVLVGYQAIEFDNGRKAFGRGDEHGGPTDRRTREYRAWKAGWDLETLLDMKAKGWP